MLRLATREVVTARQDEVQRRGRGLGWMSLGLGVAQLAAPGTVRRISGVDDSPTSRAVVPLVGARELVHAAGLLTGRRNSVWAWTRVVGDAVDRASLGMAIAHRGGRRRRRRVGVTGAVVGITVGGPVGRGAGHRGEGDWLRAAGAGLTQKEDRWS